MGPRGRAQPSSPTHRQVVFTQEVLHHGFLPWACALCPHVELCKSRATWNSWSRRPQVCHFVTSIKKNQTQSLSGTWCRRASCTLQFRRHRFLVQLRVPPACAHSPAHPLRLALQRLYTMRSPFQSSDSAAGLPPAWSPASSPCVEATGPSAPLALLRATDDPLCSLMTSPCPCLHVLLSTSTCAPNLTTSLPPGHLSLVPTGL